MQYGVSLAQMINSGTVNVVVAINCMFCIYFCREIKVKSKQERTINTMLFKSPLQSDFYKQHHSIQHLELWWEYQAADYANNMEFFEVHMLVK